MLEGCRSGVYERIAVDGAAGGFIRPGGLELTERALSLCAFPPGSRLLDVGCGTGATVEHLIGRHGFFAAGIDLSLPMIEMGSARNLLLPLIRAAAEHLPFGDAEWDGVLAECSLSLTGDPDAVLRECRRVLKRGGRLVLSDLYLKDAQAVPDFGPLHPDCGLAGALPKDALMGRLKGCGFRVFAWEDHSASLKRFAAQLIFANAAGGFSRCSPMGAVTLADFGYFLAIAEKLSEHNWK